LRNNDKSHVEFKAISLFNYVLHSSWHRSLRRTLVLYIIVHLQHYYQKSLIVFKQQYKINKIKALPQAAPLLLSFV